MKESELYPPLKAFLTAQGYEVKGEVEACDVVAVRGDEAPVIVELKLALNLEVILQAVDRLALTSKVYIGISGHKTIARRRRAQLLKLLRMLGLGLIAIDTTRKVSHVAVLLDPGEYQPRKNKRKSERLLGEFMQRVGDPNQGGMARRGGVMTVYRQRALCIARYLQTNGETKAAVIAKALDEPKARDMLYQNVYGWFERVSVGIYGLSPRGLRDIERW